MKHAILNADNSEYSDMVINRQTPTQPGQRALGHESNKAASSHATSMDMFSSHIKLNSSESKQCSGIGPSFVKADAMTNIHVISQASDQE